MIEFDRRAWSKQYEKFRRGVDEYTAILGRDNLKALKSQSVLFCLDLATVTQPFGNAKKSQTKGDQAVKKDIEKVFPSHSKMYDRIKKESEEQAKQFWYLLKNNQLTKADNFFKDVTGENTSLSPSAHKNSRNQRGRVTNTKAEANKSYIVDRKKVDGYVKEVQRKVGFAKAGWIKASEDIGIAKKRVPLWIRRHGKKTGKAVLTDIKGVKQYSIYNNVKYINMIFNQASYTTASRYRINAMKREVKKILEHRAKSI